MSYSEESYLQFDKAIPVAMDAPAVRAEFYKKTFLHVAFSVLGFMGMEILLFASGISEGIVKVLFSNTWVILGFMIGFSFASGYVQNIAYQASSKGKQYAMMFVMMAMYAVLFVPMLYMVLSYGEQGISGILMPGLIITIALFSGLVLTVFITGADFSFLKAGLTIGFLLMFGIAIIGMIFGFNLGIWFTIGMIVLMAGSILYQTSQLQNAYHKEQYVAASIGLFASFMTLLWYVLRLLMSRD